MRPSGTALAGFALGALLGGATANAQSPPVTPLPAERPPEFSQPPASAPGTGSTDAKPTETKPAETAPAELKPADTMPTATTDIAYEACLAELDRRKVTIERLGTITRDGCVIEAAVTLTAVTTRQGLVTLPGRPTLQCAFALRFSAWIAEVAAPLSAAQAGSPLGRIETGPGIVCRTRYNRPGEKVSEHAKGTAIDIAAFVLADAKRIAVREKEGDPEVNKDLLRTFRATGCGYFTTVLGPGSNAAHEEHLHFDIGQHGRTTNYRICE